MKKALFLFAIVCIASLPACQCDTPPPVGPVEDGRTGALELVLPLQA